MNQQRSTERPLMNECQKISVKFVFFVNLLTWLALIIAHIVLIIYTANGCKIGWLILWPLFASLPNLIIFISLLKRKWISNIKCKIALISMFPFSELSSIFYMAALHSFSNPCLPSPNPFIVSAIFCASGFTKIYLCCHTCHFWLYFILNSNSIDAMQEESLDNIESVRICNLKKITLTWHNVNVEKWPEFILIRFFKCIYFLICQMPHLLNRCLNGEYERMDKRKVSPVILKNVFGKAMSGELIALMGASGAGKSTLLNFQSKQLLHSVKIVGGIMKINGMAQDESSIRSLSAYVQQEVSFEECQTVWQHMKFVAYLRMAKSHSFRERCDQINDLLDIFHLKQCENTKIKSLSGGEKKRLAVASAFLNYPSILFCDEPTSGLDADKADKVVQILKQMAISRNMIIVTTIHQPSFDAFSKFDKICLMGKGGRMCFFGTIEEAQMFFEEIFQLSLPNFTNPAEFYIKELAQSEHETDPEFEHRLDEIAELFQKSHFGTRLLSECTGDALLLQQQPSTSSAAAIPIPNHQNAFSNRGNAQKEPEAAGFFQQIWAIFYRSISIAFGNVLVLCMLAASLAVPAFLGLTSDREPINQDTVMNFNGRQNLCISAMNMYLFLTINIVCKKLPIYQREYSANLYGFSPFFIAMNISDFLIFTIFQCIFAAIFHVLEQTWHWDLFLVFAACCVAVGHVAISIGYFFAFLTFSPEYATAAAPMLMLPLLSFNGFYLNRSTIHNIVFKKIDWLSYFSNAFEIMAVNKWRRVESIPGCFYEFDPKINLTAEQILALENETTVVAAIPKHCYRDGKDVLDSLNFSENNLVQDWCLLFGVFIVFRLLAYICLAIQSRRRL